MARGTAATTSLDQPKTGSMKLGLGAPTALRNAGIEVIDILSRGQDRPDRHHWEPNAMRVVIALGGNALLKRGEPLTADNQRHNVQTAARALAEVVRAGHSIVVSHGNGPQVGLLALQTAAYTATEAYPLDVLDAESEGMIGYLIEQELRNQLGGDALIATLLTQIEIDPRDSAFRSPSKPIGPVYDALHAEVEAANHGWSIAPDADGYRRVGRLPFAPADSRRASHPLPGRPGRDRHLRRRWRYSCRQEGRWWLHRRRGGDRQGSRQCASGRDGQSRRVADADRFRAVYTGFGTDDAKPIRTASRG